MSSWDLTKPVTGTMLDQLVDDLWPEMVIARQLMHEAALDLHQEVTGFRPDVRQPRYYKYWLKASIKREVVDKWNDTARSGVRVSRRIAVDAAKSHVQQVAEKSAQRTTLQAVKVPPPDDADYDDDIIGHARVAQGEYTCPFCMMLVSRGPVYQSDEYDKFQRDHRAYMDDFHTNCDCILVPVRRSQLKSWSGYRDWKGYEALWGRVTRGYSGVDALNAWRRHFYRASKLGVDPIKLNPTSKPIKRAA